jgi:hypothetical protein
VTVVSDARKCIVCRQRELRDDEPQTCRRCVTADARLCPGPCNREYREATNATGHTSITPRWGQPTWCGPCTTRIRHALSDLVELYVWLELDKAKKAATPPDQDRITLGEHASSPSPQGDNQDELVRWFMDWCEAIAELRGGERTWRGGETQRLSIAVAYLHTHLMWALESPDIGLDLGQEVIKVRANLRRVTSVGQGPRHCPAPCPRCDMRTLFQHQEGKRSWVQCHSCDRIMSTDEYGSWVGRIAGHASNDRAS